MISLDEIGTVVLEKMKLWKLSRQTIDNRLCLLYTSDAADDMQCVDLGGRRIIKKMAKKVDIPAVEGEVFFQAEDGIRDVERSRGLGDVYKRQV